jgi:hypothetical protein
MINSYNVTEQTADEEVRLVIIKCMIIYTIYLDGDPYAISNNYSYAFSVLKGPHRNLNELYKDI